MDGVSTELLLIVFCSLVVMSYLFSMASRVIRIPSVLLLLFSGVLFRIVSENYAVVIPVPNQLVESLGVVGLIMIMLEAGLDLKLHRDKLVLIRSSFFSALVILLLSTALITGILFYWLQQEVVKCLVYALPLSIMSSSIVIPSIHHLTEKKKEFLIYEASFSDVLGIVLFNYFVGDELLTGRSFLSFGSNIIIAIVLSLILSIALFFILARIRMNIKFFLIFSLLILIYSGGKLLHLPSLLIILVFGLFINNWEMISQWRLFNISGTDHLNSIRSLLHSITAESSFLIRTFFFLMFGYTIDLGFIFQKEVWIVGGMIVAALFVVRFIYLQFSLHTSAFPESFFIPRGLITIVLFYKIPEELKLSTFNDGILFFVILSTGFILALGMIFFKATPDQVLEEPQFSERNDIL